MIIAKKGYNYPIKKKIPLILLLNLFGTLIISLLMSFVKMFSEIFANRLKNKKHEAICFVFFILVPIS